MIQTFVDKVINSPTNNRALGIAISCTCRAAVVCFGMIPTIFSAAIIKQINSKNCRKPSFTKLTAKLTETFVSLKYHDQVFRFQ